VTFTSYNATVSKEGALFLHIDDVKRALAEFERLYDTLNGRAVFESSEPGFKVTLEARERGHLGFGIEMELAIEEHYRNHCSTDQTFLPPAISGLKNIIASHAHRSCD
jgi:hypothetical protein